ncbi:E3 ubiquitin-protein ligase HACE1 [Chionoecetes opilio]|uniref:E3 ubiquitin-protein ligase HACE1 n=1 Tax=Chionoecetes opilio TaxID=41210 RepID=A0A8J4Y4K3_CHIOP|nr:E3 ubiquitin-protein ligase HACE1 [Chionoecetes opilio]
MAGDVGAVDSELQRGADVDQTEEGRTALHNAAAEGLLQVVKVLLYYKANPTRRSKMEEDNGGTALHLAAEGGHLEVMEELLQAKANVEVFDSKGRQASHRAASRGHRTALEMLHSHGADMDARDAGKATPLHFAAFHGDVDTVRWLVEAAGVFTTYKDKNGRQPKDVAKKFNNMAVQRFLKNCGGGGKKGGGGGGVVGSVFGSARSRRSGRESSRDRRDTSTHRRPLESPGPSSEPESLPVAPRPQDIADAATAREDKPLHQPASLPAGMGQPVDAIGSMPSLSPPDSPHNASMDRRVQGRESRRRTRSFGGSTRSSSKGKGLKGQVEELMDIKTQAEEQVSEMRYVLDTQRQQVAEATEGQQRVLALHQQEQEAARNATARREEEVQELLGQARNDIDALRERDALSQQSIEALTKKVERLSLEGKVNEERLLQKEEALKEALRQAEKGAAAASTVLSLREEIEHLTCMMDDTRENALIIQKQQQAKIEELTEVKEAQQVTVASLSHEAEQLTRRLKEQQDSIVWYQARVWLKVNDRCG